MSTGTGIFCSLLGSLSRQVCIGDNLFSFYFQYSLLQSWEIKNFCLVLISFEIYSSFTIIIRIYPFVWVWCDACELRLIWFCFFSIIHDFVFWVVLLFVFFFPLWKNNFYNIEMFWILALECMYFTVCSWGKLIPAPLRDCTFIQCLCIFLSVLFPLLISAFSDTWPVSYLDFNLALLLIGYRKLDLFFPFGSLSSGVDGNKLSFPPVFVFLSNNH